MMGDKMYSRVTAWRYTGSTLPKSVSSSNRIKRRESAFFVAKTMERHEKRRKYEFI